MTKQTEIDALEASASAHLAAEQESFERCDTDGCVSQWAHGINAQLDRARAEILRNDGLADVLCLVDSDGDIVPAKCIPTQWGSSWLLSPEAAAKCGRKFLPTGGRSRIQKQLGLHEEMRMLPAFAFLHGSGTGLGGAASVRVVIGTDWDQLGWDF